MRSDVLVLGAGSGGYACALRAAQLGLTVALVERDRVGGTCLHEGCIPTKALLHAAEVADSARHAASIGIRASLDGVDMDGVRAWSAGVVQRLHRGLTGLVDSRGITVLEGTGRLVGAGRVAVVDGEGTESVHEASHVVVATGSHPRTLPGVEVDGTRVVDSSQALRLDRVPTSVVVLGGGVIGCEFASAWRSLGAEVVVLEALAHLVPAEEESSSRALERAFRARGITVRTGTRLAGVHPTDDGVRLVLEGGDELGAELLLVAVGRGPSTHGLGLAEHGVETRDGFVVVDEHGRTTAEHVWAVGDVVAGLQLAHRGFGQGIRVAERIAGLDPAPVPDTLVPRVTYSSPEVASVGLTRAAAVETWGEEQVRSVTYDLAGNGRSQVLGTRGSVTLVRRTDGPVVGVHMVGDRVGELIGEAQLICAWEAHPEDVTPHLHAHPTQDEALGEAHLALAGQPLHAHG